METGVTCDGISVVDVVEFGLENVAEGLDKMRMASGTFEESLNEMLSVC